MKIKEVTKTHTMVRYIADDGNEFSSQEECLAYEFRIKLTNSGIETCENNYSRPNIDGGEYYVSHFYEWYRPKNESEINLLNNAYPGLELPPTAENEWVCIDTDSLGRDPYYSFLSGGIEYIKNLMSNFGYDVIIKEREKQCITK